MHKLLIFIFSFATYAVDISYYSCGANDLIQDNVELENLVPFCAKELKLNDFCRCRETFKDKKLSKDKQKEDYNKFIARQYKKQMKKNLYSIASDLSMLAAKYQFNPAASQKFAEKCSITNLEQIKCEAKKGTFLELLKADKDEQGRGGIESLVDQFKKELATSREPHLNTPANPKGMRNSNKKISNRFYFY